MKVLMFGLFASLAFASTASAERVVCKDLYFRSVEVSPYDRSATFKGFGAVGIPNETTLSCQGDSAGGWAHLSVIDLNCSNGKVGMLMKITTVGGMSNMTLINPYGLPLFTGVCSRQ